MRAPTESPSTSPTVEPTNPGTVVITKDCHNLLAATVNKNDKLKQEHCLIPMDGMSKNYYVLNKMTSYSNLPSKK